MRTRIIFTVACVATCGLIACGGGGGGASTPTTPITPSPPLTPASPNDVLVQNNTFTLAALTVAAGTTVRWTWATRTGGADPYGGGAGKTCYDHTVTWNAGGTASPTQSEGSYQRTFSAAGTYDYHCALHGASMSGRVIVQ